MSFLGGSEPEFDDESVFVPDHIPTPSPFLDEHDVLTDEDHVAIHERTAAAFEEHGVYDATFGYNLAQLNRDPRHPDAGFRYAAERGDLPTLRAEFTPTTAFCPQAEPLAVGALRALKAEGVPGYDRVRVRVDPSLNGSDVVNDRLERLESGTEAIDGSVPGSDVPDGGGERLTGVDNPTEHVPTKADTDADRTRSRMTDVDSVLDVRELDEPPFPTISDALDDLGSDETLRLVNDFEPVPLYDVLADRGYDHETERVDDDEWHVTIESA